MADIADTWETFPAQMAEHRAFISFNKGYAQIAKEDPRTSLLKVRLELKRPTPQGLPTDEEFPDVAQVEDQLDAAVVADGGLEVGRLTVDSHRVFYFYVAFSEEKALGIVASVNDKTTYKLRYTFQQDPKKEGYWKELYPSPDDWQVIGDLRVLDSLRQAGDIGTTSRQVSHWVYLPSQRESRQFSDWANVHFYKVNSIQWADDKKQVVVRFTHEGTTELTDITRHTIAINRKVAELGGKYDGWETSVERK